MFKQEKFFDLIIKAHKDTNHFYDGYIPYEFHLMMALTFAKKYIHLIPEEYRPFVLASVIAHDAMEDARLTYNDVKSMAIRCGANEEQSTMISEMVRAVTNDGRGRNRDERMPDYIYKEIKEIHFSLFVKLCDRLANVSYGIMTGSKMPLKYRKENPHFKGKLYTNGLYESMWLELEDTFQRLN